MIEQQSKAPVSQLVNAEVNRRVTVKPRGGGGYSGFQVIGMMEWGQKSKPRKIP